MSMIKNITPLLITHGRKEFDRMEGLLTSPTARDPDMTEWSRVGFADLPTGRPVFVSADNTIVFDVQIRERVLPGKVIRTKVNERADDIAQRQGRKCSRKEMAEIKDDVIAELLPASHVKPTDILCMVTGDYLLIGTSSAKVCDTVVAVLISALDIQLKHITDRSPTSWMTDLLIEGTTDSGLYTCGSSVALRGIEKKAARFKDMDVTADKAVRDSITAGMQPVELSVMYDEKVMFRLTDKFILKGIAFSDIYVNESREENEGHANDLFDADVALTAGIVKRALHQLLIETPSNEEEEDEL